MTNEYTVCVIDAVVPADCTLELHLSAFSARPNYSTQSQNVNLRSV